MSKLKALIILSNALVVGGCGLDGYPDRRASRVVVINSEDHNPSLKADAEFALRWWRAATNDISAEVADKCDWDYACTLVKWGTLDKKDGNTIRWQNVANGHNGADITIKWGLALEDQRIVVAHEIGHSFELPHVADDHDLMYAFASPITPCIGAPTLREWADLYGDKGDLVPTCPEEIVP